MQDFAAAVDNDAMRKAMVMQGPRTMEAMCELALCWEATEPGGKIPEITYGGDGRKKDKVHASAVEIKAVMGGETATSDRAILDQTLRERANIEKMVAEAKAAEERIKPLV